MQKHLSYICLFILFSIQTGSAQQDKTLFFMHQVPESRSVNPAIMPKCRYYIALPAIGSTQLNYSNTAFAINDIVFKDGSSGNYTFDIDKSLENLHETDLINFETNINLLSLGYRLNDTYFAFSITEKLYAYTTFPKTLLQLGWNGNTQFVGDNIIMNGFRLTAVHYREYSFGITQKINDKLQLGINTKMLFGKANLHTFKSEASLYTAPITYNLLSKMHIEAASSFPVIINQDSATNEITGAEVEEPSPYDYLMNKSNIGLAADFGAIYKANDKLTFSGSILNLGFISWSSNTNQIVSDLNITYNGTGDNSNFRPINTYSQIGDSLKNLSSSKITHSPYSASIVPSIYLGASYEMTSTVNAGALLFTELYRNKIHPSMALSLNSVWLKYFSTSASWSYQNSTINNFGLGFGAKLGPVNLLLSSDNLYGLIFPEEARNLQLHFALSFLFGCTDAKTLKQKRDNKRFSCTGNPYGKQLYKYEKRPHKKPKRYRKK